MLLGLSLLVDVGAALALRSGGDIAAADDDEREYWALATTLLRGSLAEVPPRRTLPFPALIAAARAVAGDDYVRVQLLVSAVAALTPLVLYRAVRRQLGSDRVARVAALGVAVWPPFVRYGATLYSDSVGLLALSLVLMAWPVSGRESGFRWKPWVATGVLLAFCVHVKPLYLVFTPIAALLAFRTERAPRRRWLAPVFLAAGCAAALAPWSAYVSAREGRFILVSANDGETLAGGLNPTLLRMDAPLVSATAEGRVVWTGPGKWLAPEATGYLTPEELSLPYARQRELLTDRAVAWIHANPADAAYLTARKLLYMWGLRPFWNGAAQTLLGNLPLLPVAALAALGWWKLRRRWSALALFAALPLLSSAVACLAWGSWRFRMAGDVGLIVLAAAWLVAGRPPRGAPRAPAITAER